MRPPLRIHVCTEDVVMRPSMSSLPHKAQKSQPNKYYGELISKI